MLATLVDKSSVTSVRPVVCAAFCVSVCAFVVSDFSESSVFSIIVVIVSAELSVSDTVAFAGDSGFGGIFCAVSAFTNGRRCKEAVLQQGSRAFFGVQLRLALHTFFFAEKGRSHANDGTRLRPILPDAGI